VLAFVVLFSALGADRAAGQGRDDSLANGTLIGAAAGAGIGVAFTYATRDSDLVFSQYARGALVFGAIGAGVGLGVDALLDRSARGPDLAPPRRLQIAPAIWRHMTGVLVRWRF